MVDCVIAQPISEAGIAILREAGLSVFLSPFSDLDSMREALTTARAVITRNWGFSSAAIEASPFLKVIGVHGTGMDAIDLAAARTRDIQVVNTPGANAVSVAEHVMALMLACARSLPAADHAVRFGNNSFRIDQPGIELFGRRLGLLGYGHTARHVAVLGRAFGMRVHILSRHASAGEIERAGCFKVDDLSELLALSDVLSLHGVPEGAHVISSEDLAAMPRGAILINTARGALLDEAALIAALERGHLRGAALDVFQQEPLLRDSPLLRCPRLIVSPHIGGATEEALHRTGIEIAKRVVASLRELDCHVD